MGVIRKGILGGFAGKVGTIVGSNWKGIDTIRSMPASVANPKTAGQNLNRGKFKNIAVFASLLLGSVIRTFWNGKNPKMSGYNSFIKKNVENGTTESGLVYDEIVMSTGSLEGLVGVDGAGASGNTLMRITFDDNSGNGNALATDKISAVVVNATTGQITSSIKSVDREDIQLDVTIDAVTGANVFHCYVFASKLNDDSTASLSYYFTKTITA